MKMGNILTGLPKSLENEEFTCLEEGDSVKIERIVSQGHTSPQTGWYDQDQNEWVMIMEGKAVISFIDESAIYLQKGDYICIPAHKKHRVDWTDPNTKTVWLAIHYR